jgi:hypothetical protein
MTHMLRLVRRKAHVMMMLSCPCILLRI